MCLAGDGDDCSDGSAGGRSVVAGVWAREWEAETGEVERNSGGPGCLFFEENEVY